MKDERKENTKLIQIGIFTCALLLSILGIVTRYSMTTTASGTSEANAMALEYGIYLCVGVVVALIVTAFISMKTWYKTSPIIYIIAILSVMLLRSPLGINNYGALRHLIGWIKPAYIVLLAHVLRLAFLSINKVGEKTSYVRSIWVLTLISGILIILADYNALNMIVIATSFVTILICGNERTKKIHKRILLGGSLLFVILYAICQILLQDSSIYTEVTSYKLNTMLGWVNPEAFPESFGYEILAIKDVFKNITLFGVGFEKGSLCTVLPNEPEYIFVTILEEFGMVGGAVTAAILAVFCYFIFKAARKCYHDRNRFATIICAGVFVHVALASVLSILVMFNVLPNIMFTMIPFLYTAKGDVIVWYLELACVLACLKSVDSKS